MPERHSIAVSALSHETPRKAAEVVRPFNPLEDRVWAARIDNSPEISALQQTAWAQVLHSTYGFTPIYFGRWSGSGLSLLPCMQVDSWLTGRRGVSLPFTDACEPLVDDVDTFRDLVAAAFRQAAARRWRYLEIRGAATLLDAPASTSFLGHELTLGPDLSALHTNLHSSTKRNVRKAAESGVTVEFSRDLESVRMFFQLFCKTRRRLGVPPQPFRFFENLQRYMLARNAGCVALARWGRIPIAGAVFLHSRRQAIYKLGGSDEAFQHLHGNYLVMWRAIEWHAAHGFHVLDFGRTSIGNKGLRQFKLGWGSSERRIEYTRYDCRAHRFVTTPDRASGWHNRFFRMLPSRFLLRVGAGLYRHVA